MENILTIEIITPDNIHISGMIKSSYVQDNSIATVPIENGTAAADNIVEQPSKLSVEIYADNTGQSTSAAIIEALSKAIDAQKKEHKFCTIYTKEFTQENFAISNFKIENSPDKIDISIITVELTEIFIDNIGDYPQHSDFSPTKQTGTRG